MSTRSEAFHIGFLDLPIEIRLEIYGHYFKLPYPVAAFDTYPFRFTLPPLALTCRQIRDDLHKHIHDLYGRENVFAVDNMYQALTHFVNCNDNRMRRTIRHVRIINFDFLVSIDITGHFIRSSSSEYDEAWIEGKHTTFNKILQNYSRTRYFESVPDAADLSRTSQRYLPNLKTLTLDIGRIDHFGRPLQVSWLEEPQDIRDQRYRLAIQQINASPPVDIPTNLTITVNARLDPIQFADEIGAHVASQRPILNVTLTYKARGSSVVQVTELLPQWKTVQDRRSQGWELTTFPEVLVRRIIPRDAELESFPEVGTVFSRGYQPIPGFHI